MKVPPSRIRIEIVIKHYAVKDGLKFVVSVRGVVVHGLIEKAHIVESARRRGEALTDRVEIGTSRTKEGAKSTVGGGGQRGHAKVTSGRGRCSGPASKVAGLEIAVNDEIGRSWSGSGDQQNADRKNKRGYGFEWSQFIHTSF